MFSRNILVIGAAHNTGLQVLTQGLSLGHQITAFSRTADAIPVEHERLRKVAGTLPQDAVLLSNAMAGQDAVISTLGRGMSLSSHHLIEQSVPVILAAMQAHRVRRLIFTSAVGVGDAVADVPLFSQIMARVLLRNLYADKVVGERLIRDSAVEWTIVQPAALTRGPLTGQYRAAESLAMSGMPQISRADVAHFLLEQVSSVAFVRKTVTLAY